MTLGEQKKALSPLIATVLLIAFAVSIGTMIMSWSIDAPKETVETNDVCARTSISLQETTAGDAICYDEETQVVRFLLQNTGEETIKELTLRVIDEELNEDEKTLNANLAPGDLGKWEISHNTTNPETRTASIMPRVEQDSFETRSCPEKQLQEIALPTC